MFKKMLWSLVISTQITTFVLGCDQDDLGSKVMDIGGKLHDRQSISKEAIKESLGFIYDEANVRDKYKSPSNFHRLWEQKTGEIKDNPSFLSFADLCKEIYEEGIATQKSAIHMLFEKVSSKVQDYYAFQQKRSNVPVLTPETMRQKVQEFLNIDKGNDTPNSDRAGTSSNGLLIISH
jgi:hypothetical protein